MNGAFTLLNKASCVLWSGRKCSLLGDRRLDDALVQRLRCPQERSISSRESCFEGLVLTTGDLHLKGSPQWKGIQSSLGLTCHQLQVACVTPWRTGIPQARRTKTQQPQARRAYNLIRVCDRDRDQPARCPSQKQLQRHRPEWDNTGGKRPYWVLLQVSNRI